MRIHKKIIHVLNLIITAASVVIASSCADTLNSAWDSLVSGDSVAVTLSLPDVSMRSGSRGVEDPVADEKVNEAAFEHLWLFAMPQESGKGEKLVMDLKPLFDAAESTSGVFKDVTIRMKSGAYHFYALANIPDLDDKSEDKIKAMEDSDIHALVLRYSSEILPAPSSGKGLPMLAVCEDVDESGKVRIDGNTKKIVLNPAFLCAKVRYTLLFDASEGGFSQDSFGSSAICIASVKALNVDNASKVTNGKVYENYGIERFVDVAHDHRFDATNSILPQGGHCEYPNDDTLDKLLKEDGSDDVILTPLTGNPEGAKRAYQGVVYLPENLNAESPTRLKFEAIDEASGLPLEYEVVLPDPRKNAEDRLPMARGHFYDLVGRITSRNNLTDVNITVEDWTMETLASQLKGPVFLHVEKQTYEVSAGQETAIWVDSDAEDLHVDSPVYTDASGKEYDVFNYSIDEKGDSIRIWLNPDIKKSEYENIRNMDYLHIVAGPINKRIKIFPFNLDYYLFVDPQNIPIDVKTRIASGEYNGTIPVTIRTNYPTVKVSLKNGWDSMPQEEWVEDVSKHPIKVLSETNEQVWTQGVESTVTGGVLIYGVGFEGLNSGLQTWSKVSELTFSVTGVDELDQSSQKTEDVTVSVRPNLMNYTIHFKDINENWVAPHIYVYQCLEFPADWTQTYTNSVNGTTESLASKPIGHRGPDNIITSQNRFAALEYSFTGKIAFKGWDHPDNKDALYDESGNMIQFVGYKEQGFFIFKDNTLSWVVEKPEFSQLRYYFDMDFCVDHRNKIKDKCPNCSNPQSKYENTNTGFNPIWPGIMMEREEDDGWWRFELTGIAVPGKTLIMFADTHKGDSSKRFPGDAKVGVPLFDYPDREGWLLYNGNVNDRINNVFTPEKPN